MVELEELCARDDSTNSNLEGSRYVEVVPFLVHEIINNRRNTFVFVFRSIFGSLNAAH